VDYIHGRIFIGNCDATKTPGFLGDFAWETSHRWSGATGALTNTEYSCTYEPERIYQMETYMIESRKGNGFEETIEFESIAGHVTRARRAETKPQQGQQEAREERLLATLSQPTEGTEGPADGNRNSGGAAAGASARDEPSEDEAGGISASGDGQCHKKKRPNANEKAHQRTERRRHKIKNRDFEAAVEAAVEARTAEIRHRAMATAKATVASIEKKLKNETKMCQKRERRSRQKNLVKVKTIIRKVKADNRGNDGRQNKMPHGKGHRTKTVSYQERRHHLAGRLHSSKPVWRQQDRYGRHHAAAAAAPAAKSATTPPARFAPRVVVRPQVRWGRGAQI
jgi:hypothetical protein